MEKFRFVGYNKNKYIKYIVGAGSALDSHSEDLGNKIYLTYESFFTFP